MTRDRSSLVLLVVGLLLVTSPFWLLTDAGTNPREGEQVYEYRAEKIEYGAGLDGYIRAPADVERLDCYVFRDEPGCLFAAYAAQHGPVTVNASGSARYHLGSEYVAVENSGSEAHFYRRVVERTDSNVTYSLEPIGVNTLLEEIAVNESELSPKVRPTLDGETVEIYGRPLHAGEVVRTNGTYYLVYESGRWTADPVTYDAVLYRGVAFLAGLAMLRHRWRSA